MDQLGALGVVRNQHFVVTILIIAFGVGFVVGHLFAFWEYQQSAWEKYTQILQFVARLSQTAMSNGAPSAPKAVAVPLSGLALSWVGRRAMAAITN